MASQTRKNLGEGLILSIGNWLNGLILLWSQTGCPALPPVDTWSDKRSDVVARQRGIDFVHYKST